MTGPPGAGKTTILRQLELDGFSVVEEAATDIIALWQAQGIAEPWKRHAFIDAVVSLQKAREIYASCATDLIQFHDRSVICTAALASYLGFPVSETLARELKRAQSQNVFQKKVFFIRNLGFITLTEARRISFEETVRFERLHEQIYRDFGFEIISIGPGTVLDRVQKIKNALQPA